jgi:hypothetical protein
MTPVARRKALVALTAVLVLAAAALGGILAGFSQAGGARTHAAEPYLRHPEFARRALLLAKAAGIHVTPALREAARAQAARPRMLWSGASTRFSVLKHATTPSQLPAEVRRFVAFAAGATHISRDTALARVRLLRSGVGSARGGLYALEGGAGAPCFILTHYGGTCGTAGSGQSAWVIGGGHDGDPDVLVGLAPDDVVGMSLTLDGRTVPVSLDQNVVYAQFPTGGKSAQIATRHVDGTVTTEHVGLNAS